MLLVVKIAPKINIFSLWLREIKNKVVYNKKGKLSYNLEGFCVSITTSLLVAHPEYAIICIAGYNVGLIN